MTAGRGATVDALLALGLLLGSVYYVDALPRVLGGSDEGIYLYEAKRLLDGAVFYRDVFDLITPGAHYLMAGAFALLGVSIETARHVDAVVHGLIVLTTYATSRMLGVRRALASVAALAQVAVFQPAWPVASPHWVATLLGMLLLPALLGPPRARLALAAGIIAGLLVCVQQQKGVAMTAGVVALLLVERFVARTAASRWRIPAFLGGVGLVVVPVGLLLVRRAGLRPVVDALVLHPLVNYPRLNRTPWGSVGLFPWYARYTFPTALAVAPGLALLASIRAAVGFVRGVDGERLRRSVCLALVGLASIASILYYPDYIHLAFIGSVFAVLAAELLETGLRARPLAGWPATLVAVLLLGATGAQLARVMTGSWRDYPLAYDSPFGRVRFHERQELEIVERIRAILDRAPSRELFVYPFGAGMYLLTGTENPTPFLFLVPEYSRPNQIELTLAILERRRVPYLFVIKPLTSTDAILRYVAAHYEQVEDERGPLPLFRRRPEPG